MSGTGVLNLAIYLVVTYFVCGIPFGKLVASRGGHVDIQSVGSGNIGTTNVARTVGAKLAGVTLLGDAGKGFLCTLLAPAYAASACGVAPAELAPGAGCGWVCALVMLVCVVGHVFSPYLRFHGGKGIATGFGAALGFAWPVALGLLAVFAAFAAARRIVSLASCAAAVSLPVWAVLIYRPEPPFALIMVATAALVLWAHRTNIAKLARGEEQPFSFHHDD